MAVKRVVVWAEAKKR